MSFCFIKRLWRGNFDRVDWRNEFPVAHEQLPRREDRQTFSSWTRKSGSEF